MPTIRFLYVILEFLFLESVDPLTLHEKWYIFQGEVTTVFF